MLADGINKVVSAVIFRQIYRRQPLDRARHTQNQRCTPSLDRRCSSRCRTD